mgnify:CR=1 FL=1
MTIIENDNNTTSIIIEDNEKDKYVLCIKRKDDMLHVESIRSKPRKTKGVSK